MFYDTQSIRGKKFKEDFKHFNISFILLLFPIYNFVFIFFILFLWQNITLEFNKTDGLLQSVTKNGKTWPFYQNFYIYNAAKGYNYNADTRASGAYIFRPIEIDPKPVSLTANITQYHGK